MSNNTKAKLKEKYLSMSDNALSNEEVKIRKEILIAKGKHQIIVKTDGAKPFEKGRDWRVLKYELALISTVINQRLVKRVQT